MAGLEVGIQNLSKSFGRANIWNDVTLTLPAGEISALLGPSGTGLGTARSMPDNIGMLFRRNLVMFGPREVLLTSEEPVVQQFLQGRRIGPIGMSEEKDSAQMEAEMEELRKKGGSTESEESFIDPQIDPTEGLGDRPAVQRRKDRVMQVLPTLPAKARGRSSSS